MHWRRCVPLPKEAHETSFAKYCVTASSVRPPRPSCAECQPGSTETSHNAPQAPIITIERSIRSTSHCQTKCGASGPRCAMDATATWLPKICRRAHDAAAGPVCEFLGVPSPDQRCCGQAGVQIATGMWVDRSAVKSQGDNLDAFGRQMKEVFGLDLCDMTGFAPPTSLV